MCTGHGIYIQYTFPFYALSHVATQPSAIITSINMFGRQKIAAADVDFEFYDTQICKILNVDIGNSLAKYSVTEREVA